MFDQAETLWEIVYIYNPNKSPVSILPPKKCLLVIRYMESDQLAKFTKYIFQIGIECIFLYGNDSLAASCPGPQKSIISRCWSVCALDLTAGIGEPFWKPSEPTPNTNLWQSVGELVLTQKT